MYDDTDCSHGGPFGIRFHPEATGPCRLEHGTRHPKAAKCVAKAERSSRVFRLISVASKMRTMRNLEANRITLLNVSLRSEVLTDSTSLAIIHHQAHGITSQRPPLRSTCSVIGRTQPNNHADQVSPKSVLHGPRRDENFDGHPCLTVRITRIRPLVPK